MVAWLKSWVTPLSVHLVLIFIIFQMLVLSAAFMVWMERKVCAYIQDRLGPNRVGYAGWLQPFADVIKLITKEELRPKAADAILFSIAPVLSAATAFAAFSTPTCPRLATRKRVCRFTRSTAPPVGPPTTCCVASTRSSSTCKTSA